MGKSDDTRERIYDAIFSLMETTPAARISAEAAARAAGISRSSFYRYFSSVNDAVKDYEEELLAVLSRINELSLRVRFSSLDAHATSSLIEAFEVVEGNRSRICALNGPNGDPAFERKIEVMVERTLRERIPDELKARFSDFGTFVSFAVAGHNAAVNHWLRERPGVGFEEFAADISRLMYAPLFYEGWEK